jgi:hypothetical protein
VAERDSTLGSLSHLWSSGWPRHCKLASLWAPPPARSKEPLQEESPDPCMSPIEVQPGGEHGSSFRWVSEGPMKHLERVYGWGLRSSIGDLFSSFA